MPRERRSTLPEARRLCEQHGEHVTPDESRRRARNLEHLNVFISLTNEQGKGPVVAVKDLIDVRGTATTAGSDLLPDKVSDFDAQVVAEIRKHGCVVMGKANLHEWALGATSNNRHYGPVRNPHDPERVAGGSSGGSAAAVAAQMCDWSIGTDSAGSVRIPAALCGVVGIRPTIGTVSTEGVIPLSPSMDTVGPLAKDVRTMASALAMMSGIDGLVPDGIPSMQSLSLAVPAGWIFDLDEETQSTWKHISYGLPEVEFPDRRRLYDCATTVVLEEAARFHRRRIEQQANRYDPDVLKDLKVGLDLSRERYVSALAERRELDNEVEEIMGHWDAVITPTTSCVAPLIDANGEVRERLNRYTRPLSLSGNPVISVPGPTEGLPVGIQVFGRFGEDATLLSIALALEENWKK